MKAKSMKLRFMITLQTLFKYSDREHRLTSVKLNEHLRPYGLECSRRVLANTAEELNNFGLDVRFNGAFHRQGFWMENRPLSDDALNRIIFAVTTNPHITKEEATEILSALKPFVTVYQEDLLRGTVDTSVPIPLNASLESIYATIVEAIQLNRRICYTKEDICYDKENKMVYQNEQWYTLFTPKSIYQTKGELYLFGYNHPDKRIEAVNLKNIKHIKSAFKHNMPNAEKIYDMLKAANPQDYIPEVKTEVLYIGPITFYCRGQFLPVLYRKFGPADKPIHKNKRCVAEYHVGNAVINSETVFWLLSNKSMIIKIKAPESFKNAVQDYIKSLNIVIE